MLSYNGATPYNARFGTQPAMLPDIHALHDDSLSMDGRSMQRDFRPHFAFCSRLSAPPERIRKYAQASRVSWEVGETQGVWLNGLSHASVLMHALLWCNRRELLFVLPPLRTCTFPGRVAEWTGVHMGGAYSAPQPHRAALPDRPTIWPRIGQIWTDFDSVCAELDQFRNNVGL